MTQAVEAHHAAERAGVIKIRVTDIAQLFNSFDPTPFPDRDLDDDAEEFIVSWAKELPRGVPLLIRIELGHPGVVPDTLERVREAIHLNFTHREEIARLRFRQLMSIGRLSLLIGIGCLAVCIVIADLVARWSNGPLTDIIQSSLIIGGWVAMWRPIEILLYDWWPLLRERHIYRRLCCAEVEIVAVTVEPPRSH